jgi:hypothetical protein
VSAEELLLRMGTPFRPNQKTQGHAQGMALFGLGVEVTVPTCDDGGP